MSVYFVTARQVGMVKIGCAFNPRRRFATLQTASPIELALEAWVAGSHTEEREYHVRFEHLRVRGEWFTLSAEVEQIIAANPLPSTKSTPLFLKRAREMQRTKKDYRQSSELSRDANRYAAAMAEMQPEAIERNTNMLRKLVEG